MDLDLLTTQELMQLLGVSHSTILHAVHTGKLVQTKLSPRNIRYHRDDIQAWIDAARGKKRGR